VGDRGVAGGVAARTDRARVECVHVPGDGDDHRVATRRPQVRQGGIALWLVEGFAITPAHVVGAIPLPWTHLGCIGNGQCERARYTGFALGVPHHSLSGREGTEHSA